MSLASWKEEFYPVEADEFVESLKTQGLSPQQFDEKLIEHSLKKWQGALPKNANKHNVQYLMHAMREDGCRGYFGFHTEGCTLCDAYYGADDSINRCRKCPIYRMTGANCNEAYQGSTNSPLVMITLLKENSQVC